MNVLVTGFAGYLGPVIVRRLKEAGHTVIGLDTGWFLPNYAEPPVWPDGFLMCDLRDFYPLIPFDAVVHLAGLSNDPLGDLDEDLTEQINVGGTLGIVNGLELARHVIISSCAIYGATAELATEDTPPNPLTAYARGKLRVDTLAPVLGGNFVSLRLGTAFGYSPGHRLDVVVNKMVHDAINGRPVTVNGNASRPLVHVDDVASAVLFMLDREEQGVYNVVSDNWRMADLGRVVADFSGVKLVLDDGGPDQRDYMASPKKLIDLGWYPTRTVDGSLPVLFEHTLKLPPGDYVRLSALKRLIDAGSLTPSLRSTIPEGTPA
ncbi:MAG: SDR family oxidoreductase [Trueperaceae bacterium]|nr:SDR family oxidoreductase [Trueperaceae bacterium]